jgi:hypothetical protein
MRDATRKHTALPHFLCGEQGAADKQQHARSIVLANQCATRHRRQTQDATYDRCCSMQQPHANRLNATGNSMHGMRAETKGSRTLVETYEMMISEEMNGIRTLSLLEAAPGFLHSRNSPQGASVRLNKFHPARGDASDVAARRLHISFACGHRWPTDVDRPRCGIRTRLGAREAHAVWFLLHPATATASFTRSDEASGSFYNVSPQRTRGSSFAPLFPMRCHACTSWLSHACSRRVTSRQARSA